MVSRTRYHWNLRYDDPLMAPEVFDSVLRVMRIWQRRWPNRYDGGLAEGSALGLLNVSMVCMGHDQWWAHQWSTRFARALAVSSRVRVEQVVDPAPADLHETRVRPGRFGNPSSTVD